MAYIVLRLLVEMHQQAAKAVHPGMRPFDYSTPRFEVCFPLDRLRLFPTRAHMSGKAELLRNGIVSLQPPHLHWQMLDAGNKIGTQPCNWAVHTDFIQMRQ